MIGTRASASLLLETKFGLLEGMLRRCRCGTLSLTIILTRDMNRGRTGVEEDFDLL